MKIKMEALPIDESLLHLLTGDPENMDTPDKLKTMKTMYSQAVDVKPDYDNARREMASYAVSLPEVVTVPDISAVNRLYAITQSYLSRVTAIELVAIDNDSRWERLYNMMDGYISDKEAEILLTEEVKGLQNVRLQQASVRNKLGREMETLRVLEAEKSDADSFLKQVVAKKKDLAMILTNLSRQVRALSIEHSLTRN